MLEAVIQLLIWLIVLAIVVYVIQWVLSVIGISIPDQIMKLVWLALALVALLMILKTILPAAGVRLGMMASTLLI